MIIVLACLLVAQEPAPPWRPEATYQHLSTWALDEVFEQPTFFILDIEEDSDHFIWLASRTEGLVRTDGKRFESVGESAGIPGGAFVTLTQDPNGALWLVTTDGIAAWQHGLWTTMTFREDPLPELTFTTGVHQDIAFLGDFAYFNSVEGLVRMPRQPASESHESSWAGQVALLPLEPRTGAHERVREVMVLQDRELLISTVSGLYRSENPEGACTFESMAQTQGVTFAHGATTADGSVWLWNPQDLAIWQVTETHTIIHDADSGLPITGASAILADPRFPDGLVIPDGGETWYHRQGHWQRLSTDWKIQTQFVRAEVHSDGSVWLGGEELWRIAPASARSVRFEELREDLLPQEAAIAETDSEFVVALHDELLSLPKDGSRAASVRLADSRLDSPECLLPAGGKALWYANRRGIYWIDDGVTPLLQFKAPRSVSSCKLSPDGAVWMGAANELFILEDRQTLTRLRTPFPGAGISRVLPFSKDDGWLGSVTGDLARYQHESVERVETDNKLPPGYITAMHRYDSESIVAIVLGDIFRVYPHGDVDNLSKQWGGMTATYLLPGDSSKAFWLYSPSGMTKVSDLKVLKEFRAEEGFLNLSPVNGSIRASDGRYWLNQFGGFTLFDPESGQPNPPPPTPVIDKLWVNGEPVPVPTATLSLPYSQNSLHFHFASPYFFDGERLTLWYQLVGFDDEWQEAQGRHAVQHAFYTNLPGGRQYEFRVKAETYSGRVSTATESLAFAVEMPWYGQWWFIVLVAIAIMASAFGIYRWRVYALIVRGRHLEQMVDERTQQIISQRNELQEKQVSLQRQQQIITENLTYAQHLQESLMPSHDILDNLGAERFVYYRPKSMVGGDFYWIRQINDAVVCAVVDCTGHGVPGALMSVLGFGLLNVIETAGHLRDPARALEELDLALREQLNPKKVRRRVNEGMELGLLLVEPEQRRLTYAGSMTPLYVVSDTVVRVKGTRRSIASTLSTSQMPFEQTTIEWTAPTCIYMATDGFFDQLTRYGKKHGLGKSNKLWRTWLAQHKMLSMGHQASLLETWLNTIIDEDDQVDDITVLGLRLQ